MKPALVVDEILQRLNWQRQDSLTRSQVARTLSWELVPSRPVGPESKECFICKNLRNALSASHHTLDGCDAMATPLLLQASTKFAFLTSPSRWKLTRAKVKEDRCHQSVGPGIQRQAGQAGREILEC